jgi:hypothetical protein
VVTTTRSPAVTLNAGQSYDIKVEYREVSGKAAMSLQWLTPGGSAFVMIPLSALEPVGAGLTGDYFTNNGLSGSPLLTRQETPQFSGGTGSPDPSIPTDNFSARWSGTFTVPTDGQYVFRTESDDGVRLWINNALVVDNWTPHAPTLNSTAPIMLGAGYRYDIKLEWQELTGGAVIRLDWQPPGSGFGAIPVDRLYAN